MQTRSTDPDPAAGGSRACPSNQVMAQYLADQLTPGARHQIMNHLQTCPTCRAKRDDFRRRRRRVRPTDFKFRLQPWRRNA